MKKIIISAALLAMVSLVSVSCQKETISESQNAVSEVGTMRIICYTIDGVTQAIVLNGDTDWNEFILRMIALAEEGHSVRVFGGSPTSKSIVHFNSQLSSYE